MRPGAVEGDADLVEVFVLYELEGLTSPEIAELLNIPLGSVASRFRRAREQFRSAAARVERASKRKGSHEPAWTTCPNG